MTSVGVPIKILHEAEGHVVTLETVTGEVYRGKLIEAEDNMNCQMSDVVVTFRDGRNHQLDNVFIRGNKGAIGMGLGGLDQIRGGRGGRGTTFRGGR
uniref:Small nuclear ribonucleoprotein Sm D3 n=1 Tax=Heterorhabditis bacteriophora TaxID=37862 RepID=A0A1I7WCX4_HETBA